MWPEENVRVIRSTRRRRTVQARLVGGVLEVRIPAAFTEEQERDAVEEMTGRLTRKAATSHRTDDDLLARARRLNSDVLGGQARVSTIRWSSRQNFRWGSCTVSTGDIRISDRLKNVPDYVVDAVIVHELAHTIVAEHSAAFWELADRAPQAERAKGYLEAYQRFGG
ncbi:M48 family metallopeptidase [Corynebacterium qintianiae]|uniref:M48 metallopeptidase family protein n=1 Tax=Corynebacterium qintianiae TaxID=2709392 RepID=UPI0013EC3DB9|nr:YgjP-like metallopeptidase domain-containing protein [Corynebacterium qintianiae]